MAPASLIPSVLGVVKPPAHSASGGIGVALEVVLAVVVGCALLTVTVLLLGRHQQRRRTRLHEERAARQAMDEMCPQGWSARITLYGERAPLPDDAPDGREGRRVAVEWTEFERTERGGTQAAVTRRMWARTIPGALRGVVADRRLDRELEEIENRALMDDAAKRA